MALEHLEGLGMASIEGAGVSTNFLVVQVVKNPQFVEMPSSYIAEYPCLVKNKLKIYWHCIGWTSPMPFPRYENKWATSYSLPKISPGLLPQSRLSFSQSSLLVQSSFPSIEHSYSYV